MVGNWKFGVSRRGGLFGRGAQTGGRGRPRYPAHIIRNGGGSLGLLGFYESQNGLLGWVLGEGVKISKTLACQRSSTPPPCAPFFGNHFIFHVHRIDARTA